MTEVSDVSSEYVARLDAQIAKLSEHDRWPEDVYYRALDEARAKLKCENPKDPKILDLIPRLGRAAALVQISEPITQFFRMGDEEREALRKITIETLVRLRNDLGGPASDDSSDSETDDIEWSKAHSPTYWRTVYAVDGVAISQDTFKRMVDADEIRINPKGTVKRIRIDKRDLPPGYKED